MELQEVVNEESRLKSTHSLVRLLCGLLAHRASDKVIVFLEFHGQSAKTAITERVETGQCPGLSVAIQTDWTGQLLLKILESLTSCGKFLCQSWCVSKHNAWIDFTTHQILGVD